MSLTPDMMPAWELREHLKQRDDQITALRADNERLRAALRDARECVQAWSGYASEYFCEKHDLAGDLARIDAALEGKP